VRASTDNARTEVLPLKVALRGALRESSEAKWGCRGSDCGAGWARGAAMSTGCSASERRRVSSLVHHREVQSPCSRVLQLRASAAQRAAKARHGPPGRPRALQ
jgi:hypothetical protein